jgi:hypothetical protein
MLASPSVRRLLVGLCIVALLLTVATAGGTHAAAILSASADGVAPDPGARLVANGSASAPSRSPHPAAAPRAPPIA